MIKLRFYFAILILIASCSDLSGSRLWGIIKKSNSSLILDYNILYKQLLELQLQGNSGNFSDWPYNSDDGWGFIKYNHLILNSSSDIFKSSNVAINDPNFINAINEILNVNENTRISIGHVRNSTSGSFSIPNPHPFIFNLNNRSYAFAHNGTIDKIGLMSLLTENNTDSSWIRQNPPNSHSCGYWEDEGFNCVVDSELFFLWIMKNIIQIGDDLRGLLNALSILENTNLEISDYYGEQLNFIFSNGIEIFAYKSASQLTEESRHDLYYKSYDNHFSVMSSPLSIDNDYNKIRDKELLILSGNNQEEIRIIPNIYQYTLLDEQILNDIILLNNLDEVNCLTCNNNGLLEPQELGIQVWENNVLVSLDLSYYMNNDFFLLPSSVHLFNGLNSFQGSNIKIIPEISCSELPNPISTQLQCDLYGCTDPLACNYDSYADTDDGTCIYENFDQNCDNSCIIDLDEDNNCDEISALGCVDTQAINFNPNASINLNCFYDNILLLKRGNNLISLPQNMNNINILEYLDQNPNIFFPINFILGEGVGIFNINGTWSGNLDNFNIKKGYWFNSEMNFSWHMHDENNPSDNNECLEYHLSEGNNLISYTGSQNNVVLDALNGEQFSQNFNFILGQSVGLFNTEQGWAGNLHSLQKRKGYWLNSNYQMNFFWGNECDDTFIQDSYLNKKIDNFFNVNQSTSQSFYLIEKIEVSDPIPTLDDYILAFYDNNLIGYSKYHEDLTILPVMGKDYSSHTINYIETGIKPDFKFFSSKNNKIINLEGNIPSYENLKVSVISNLRSETNSLSKEFDTFEVLPNPFNSSSNIKFNLSQESYVVVDIYNINGKLMKSLPSRNLKQGSHIINFDMIPYSSGVYFLVIKIVNEKYNTIENRVQKILFLK
ncbi:MAG: class II glutamine amidotransferase [Candidatus Neomarinimicrobiota bacterium]|nr:class II glutamine amidotransferase [Candidatus Neomarinimicrobiota bacterium]